jgi:hypothetical protein
LAARDLDGLACSKPVATLTSAVEVRHSADHAQQQATEQGPKDPRTPEDMAREILGTLSTVVAVLPADELRCHLNQVKSLLV